MPPAKKRRRISTTQETAPSQPEEDKHSLFTQWSQARGVQFTSIKPAIIPGRGVGLLTTAKISKDDQIIFVPKNAMFTPNTVESHTKKPSPSPSPSPQAHLAISIMSECLSPSSPYLTWKKTWPTLSDFESGMPLFWSPELCHHLPESVKQPLERMREDYEKDLTYMLSLNCDDQIWKEEDFKYYWAIVNSRCFHFKPPGLKPGFMVLCPFIDYMNHGPTGTGVKVSQSPKGYEVVADRDYEPNTEILATYGSHPNDKLLVHYGFCLSYEPNEPSDDDIRLDHILLPAMSANTKSQLQDVGMLGSYALLPPSAQRKQAELCFKTQVAIRAELLTANEWEYFMLNGEDMTSDHSAKVAAWLRPRLQGYRSQVKRKLEELEKLEMEVVEGSSEAGAVSWLRFRWMQIAEALDAWLDQE